MEDLQHSCQNVVFKCWASLLDNLPMFRLTGKSFHSGLHVGKDPMEFLCHMLNYMKKIIRSLKE